jgi:hypothetical protein
MMITKETEAEILRLYHAENWKRGTMSYDSRFADLLYEVISARYQTASTIVTTNKVFKEWGEIFPHAACVVTLVDRLLHKSETVLIDGESFRHKEAAERAAEKERVRQRSRRRKKGEQAC